MTEEVKNEVEEVVETTEAPEKSYIEMIAEKMSHEARHNSFYQLDEKPTDKPDIDNAAKQNAEKLNAPGEKAVPAGPTETKGGAGGSTARPADKAAGDKAPLKMKNGAVVAENPDNAAAYKAMNVELGEAKDLDADNAEKELKHDCATHVVHKEHGEGKCVPGMHTLEEKEDGTGYVTHYDVMFDGEEGPYIVEDCPVEELEIVQEMSHGHKKKKSKMTEDTMYGADPDNNSPAHHKAYDKHQNKVIAHAKKMGYKVNHDGHPDHPDNKHKNPDITLHTGYDDDTPSAYTVHKNGKAANDKVVHNKKYA